MLPGPTMAARVFVVPISVPILTAPSQRRLVAIAAPSASAANLAHTTVGCTSGENVAREENPQSALAMTFSRPTSPAYGQMPSAISSGCST